VSHIPVPPLCQLVDQRSKNIVVQCHTNYQENKSNNLKQEYIVLELKKGNIRLNKYKLYKDNHQMFVGSSHVTTQKEKKKNYL